MKTYRVQMDSKNEERFETNIYGMNVKATKVYSGNYDVELTEEQATKWRNQFSWMRIYG